ncbi:Rieske (2Fe-2S) protein [Glycomyces sp. A-F 0318]|uniref:DUF5914 domain-containing protein n=1 Tax=Glycomyces amatae TaxID=2881355 RepID=UPI001E57D3F2|nr:DUF5914 domain-containing protein [Glycomyces amatae]MCD0443168.1 Rieske (2Fe-2S) protein [Glycomyces amatae]
MSLFTRRGEGLPLTRVDPGEWAGQRPTYRDARPDLIESAAERAAARPSGNWFVLAPSGAIRSDRPYGGAIGRHEVVAWRGESGRLIAGPGACPHLGAPLAQGRLDCGTLRCRWHGLALDGDGGPGWRPLPAHDDGVLAWVRLDGFGGERPLPEPVIARRPDPAGSVAAVATLTGICEPGDVIANRMDPWHGAWFHPHSFTRLTVVSTPDDAADGDAEADRFVVDVTFRVGRRTGVPVRAEFFSPEPRTLVMRIVEGEGRGSVVETHAVPSAPGVDGRPRTSVVEAVVATSHRAGFKAARRVAPALRLLMRRAAVRLWREDLAYAERRYALRSGDLGAQRP